MTGVAKKELRTMDYSANAIQNDRLCSDMEAILSRDQRTTSHRVLDDRSKQRPVFGTPASTGLRSENHQRSAQKIITGASRRSFHLRSNSRKRIRGYAGCRGFNVTWLRLGSLLVTLLVVTIHAAPTMNPEKLNSQRKWVNPCGLSSTAVEGDLDVVQLTDEELISQIVVQAKTALMHANIFRYDYVKQTFRDDFDNLNAEWASKRYDWLPSLDEIPKTLGKPLSQKFLDVLELNSALIDAYEYMQKYAVGLEQVVWDQKNHTDGEKELKKNFTDTEFKLRAVLCELQVALVERGVTPRPDVSRDVMPRELRAATDSSFRDLRNWLIFRDYMNGLEYVIQVFEYFGDHLRP